MEPQELKIENWDKEEWGGWKFVSNMLDNPDSLGIYKTSKCYEELYEFVCAQKQKSYEEGHFEGYGDKVSFLDAVHNETEKSRQEGYNRGRLRCLQQHYGDELKYREELACLKEQERILGLISRYLEHNSNCIRSQFAAGEPTKDGYRMKFANKWYQSSPIDKTPKCDCGLEKALEDIKKAIIN